MRFGQIVIGINLLMEHQASGAPLVVTPEIGNHAIPHGVASQTAFEPSGIGLQVAQGNPEETLRHMRSVFQQKYGVDPETASHRELEDATRPQAPFHFSNPESPGINPNEISPNTKITEQIGVGKKDLGQPYMAPEPAYAPLINPNEISPNTKINPQIGVAWQDLDPDYYVSGTSISPGINPAVHTAVSDHQGSDHQVLPNFTGAQWAGVGIVGVSAAAVISVIGRLPWRAYLKYGRKDDIPITPPEVTNIWNFLKSKMQRLTHPKSKTPVLEMALEENKIPAQKVDKSPMDTIGNMEGQVWV